MSRVSRAGTAWRCIWQNGNPLMAMGIAALGIWLYAWARTGHPFSARLPETVLVLDGLLLGMHLGPWLVYRPPLKRVEIASVLLWVAGAVAVGFLHRWRTAAGLFVMLVGVSAGMAAIHEIKRRLE